MLLAGWAARIEYLRIVEFLGPRAPGRGTGIDRSRGATRPWPLLRGAPALIPTTSYARAGRSRQLNDEAHVWTFEGGKLTRQGSVIFRVGDEERSLSAGGIWRISSDTRHSVVAGGAGAVVIDKLLAATERLDSSRIPPTVSTLLAVTSIAPARAS